MKNEKISQRLRKDADSIWKEIFNHPFVVELYKGALPMEKFKFYVLQDYNYLAADMKNLSILSSKAESVEAMREMIQVAHLEATSEFKGYEELLTKLGYTVEDAIRIEPTPTNISYASFLLATSSVKTFWEGLAAALPCFWIYAEIAEFHRDKLKENKNCLYVEWASVYLTEPYRDLIERMKGLLDEANVEYGKLKEAFIIASKYEYLYWSMAYNMEKWPA
jgi:thiaminase/transcriptional activator TenA